MNKKTKAILTTALGATLLLSGSTYALWTSNVDQSTAATIQIGTSDLSSQDTGRWIDKTFASSNPEDPDVIIEDVSLFKAVPGDKLTFNKKFTITPAGSGSKTNFSVNLPKSVDLDITALKTRGLDFNIEIIDSSTGESVASSTNEDGSLKAEYSFIPTENNTTRIFDVNFNFDFNSEVTADDTKNLELLIGNASVIAEQIN